MEQVDLAKQELICPMCMDLFRQPRSLKCLHTYCEECLIGLHRSTGKPSAIICPECRKPTEIGGRSGIEGLPLNFKLSNLVKILDVDARKEIVSQTRHSLRMVSIKPACPHHPDKNLQCFCESCQTLICIQCVNSHKDHGKISDAMDTLPEHVKSLKEMLPLAETASRLGQHKLEELSSELDLMRSSGDKAIGAVHSYFSKVRSILERREEEIVLSMTFQIDNRSADMVQQQKSLRESVSTLHQCKDAINNIVSQRSADIKLLLEETAIKNRLRFHADSVKVECENTTSPNVAHFEDHVVFNADFEVQCSQIGLVKPQIPPRQRTTTTRPPVPKKKPTLGKQTSSDTVFTPSSNRKDALEKPFLSDLKTADSVPSPALPLRHESSSDILQPHMEISAKLLTGTINPTARQDVFPHGITTGNDATIVVTDIRNSNIRILRSTGKLLEVVKQEGGAKVTEPTAVACDNEGNLLVADKSSASRIVKLSHQGKYIKQFATRPTLKLMTPYLGEPMGLAVDQDNSLYVTDMQSERLGLHIFDTQTGKYLKKFEMATQVVMQAPAGIAIDAGKGRLVVVDKGSHCFWILSFAGELLRKVGKQGRGAGDLYYPFGVAIDKDGNIYISESGNHRISVFTAGGQFIKCIGKKGAEPGLFDHPRHLCIDDGQKLLVADEMNHRVQIFKL